jgi:hypothetical protein
MIEEVQKAIMFSSCLSSVSWLMVCRFMLLATAFVVNLSSSRIERHIHGVPDIRIKELFDLSYRVISGIIFLGFFIASLLLLIPGTILLYNHEYSLLILSSIILGILAFIFNLVTGFIEIEGGRSIVSFLLAISIILYLIGNYTGY